MSIRDHSPDELLSPYRVLDLSNESGFLCGKILGDLGADVIKIEPPGGDLARRFSPLRRQRDDPDASLYWLSYNTNKRGITLDIDQPGGQDLLRRLVLSADFLVETYPPGFLEHRGLGFQTLRRLNPRLIVVSITPFGQTGPYRNYRNSDLVAMAMSGMMSLIGEPHRDPLRVTLPQSPMWAGMYAAAGGLTAHLHRELHGQGQQVDVSLQSGLLWALANAPSFWATNRTYPVRKGKDITGRSVTGATMQAIFRCRDGFLNFIVYGGDAGQQSNRALVEWMNESGIAVDGLLDKDWGSFDISETTQDEIDEIERPARELFLSITKAEFLDEAHKRGILGYPVADSRDILEDHHLHERQFWTSLKFPSMDRVLKIPGPFAKFSATPIRISRPSPGIGEHNGEVYQRELGLTDEERSDLEHRKII